MSTTGIVRKVDELGRIVLPIEMRRMLGIGQNDRLLITINGDTVSLTKYQEHCIFCDSGEELITFRDKCICRSCINSLIPLIT